MTVTSTASSALGTATLAVSVTQQTGTAPFDDDSAPGNDSSETNNVLRTNDRIVYNVSIASVGGAANGAVFTMKLPRGVVADSVPPYCGFGSSLVPPLVPYSAPPITLTSWTNLPVQTLTCSIGNRSQSSTLSYPVTGRLRGEVPNGTVLVAHTTATFSGSGTFVPASEPTAFVSARAQVDVSINGPGPTANTGYVGGAQTVACPSRPQQKCIRYLFPLSIAAAKSGKGSTPLQSPVTFREDVSAASLYAGLLTPSEIAVIEADPATYGVEIECESSTVWSNPSASLAPGRPSEQSVRDSGLITCTQTAANQPLALSIANADTSASTVPSQMAYPAGSALPSDQGYLIVGGVNMYLPVATVRQFGTVTTGVNSSVALPWTNVLRDFAPVGFDGASNNPAAQALFNDHRDADAKIMANGFLSASYAGDPGAVGNTPADAYIPGWEIAEGIPGTAKQFSGDGTVLAGQKYLGMMILGNGPNSSAFDGLSKACASWDNSQQLLVTAPFGSSTTAQSIASNGRPAWVSGYTTGNFPYDALVGAGQTVIEYGTGLSGPSADCSDSGSPDGWYADPALVPGNDSTALSHGKYTSVTKVRVFARLPGSDAGTYLMVSVGLEALPNPLGTTLALWASYNGHFVAAPTTPATDREAFRSGELAALHDEAAFPFRHGTFDVSTGSGSFGDRVSVGAALARLQQSIVEPSPGAALASAGGRVGYRLLPSLQAALPSSTELVTTIEDCLPPHLAYLPTSASASAAMVQVGSSPVGAGITCGPGETYLRWNLGAVAVNTTLNPVTFSAAISALTPTDSSLTNRATISAAGDVSPAALRSTSTTISIINPTGIRVDTTATSPVNELNTADETVKDRQTWDIAIANVGVNGIADLDVIDVLPADGVNGSSFSRPLRLLSFTAEPGSEGNADQVLYTADSASGVKSDPTLDTSSWCDAVTGGVSVIGAGPCPTGLGTVTAIRLRRAGVVAPNSQRLYHLTMLADTNEGGDMYVNRVEAHASGLPVNIGPSDATEVVVSSQIGDLVWLDANHNGVQDVGEPPVAGVTVSLTGRDADANLVSRMTVTNGAGRYSFAGLSSSDSNGYVLRFSLGTATQLTSRAVFTKTSAGSPLTDSDADQSGVTTAVVLGQNTVDNSIDVGVFVPGSLTAHLWFDRNADSVRNVDEPGLGGGTAVAVWLGPDGVVGGGDDLPFTAPVDTNGDAILDNLPAGTFQLSAIGLDPALVRTSVAVDTVVGDGLFAPNNGGAVAFGYTVRFRLGDRVFLDTNANGRFDAGIDVAPPVGTTVQLLDSAGQVVATTTTSGSGTYAFSNLLSGSYSVLIPTAALSGGLAGATPSLHAVSNPNNDVDDRGDHNAVASSVGIIAGPVLLSATLSSRAGDQVTGNEPSGGGFTNDTVDLGLLGAAELSVVREVCATGTQCPAGAAIGASGWTKSNTFTYGQPVLWRTTITNVGLQDVQDVSVSVATEPACDLGGLALATGGSAGRTCLTAHLLGAKVDSLASVRARTLAGTNVVASDSATALLPSLTAVLAVSSQLNGFDTSRLPYVSAPGELLTMTISVRNEGSLDLVDVSVTDDAGAHVTCPGGGGVIARLVVGAEATCVRSFGPAADSGWILHVATVIATSVPTAAPDGSILPARTVSASSTAQAFTSRAAVGISETVATNGIFVEGNSLEDAPRAKVGSLATWNFVVTNRGNADLIGVHVATTAGGAHCPGESGGQVRLTAGESLVCSSVSLISSMGLFQNVAVVYGTPEVSALPGQNPDRTAAVSASDQANVIGTPAEGLPAVA